MSDSKDRSNWKICEFVAHGANVNCLALSPGNGRTLATGGEDRRVNVWMVGNPTPLLTISGMTSPVQSVAFNNAENWVAAGSKSGVIKVFDCEENRVVRTISGHIAAVCSLDFHRYGDILASGSMDTNLKLWDVRRKGCIFTYHGHKEVINSLQFTPDGKWIVSASDDKTAKVWDLSAGRVLFDKMSHNGPVTAVRFHPKELLLATATGSADKRVRFWDLDSMRLVSETQPESNGIRCIHFDAKGDVLYTGSQDMLKGYTCEPAKNVYTQPVSWGKVASIAQSGEQLIGASFQQTSVSLWCIDTKRLKHKANEDEVLAAHLPQQQQTHQSLSSSSRKQFEYSKQERPFTQASSQPPAVESRRESTGDDGGDSPPTNNEMQLEERKQLFEYRQKLVLTPPEKYASPFQPPPEDIAPAVSNSEGDFKPGPVKFPNSAVDHDNRCLAEIKKNHSDICQALHNRLRTIQEAYSKWSLNDPKPALEATINTGDQSATVDLLTLMLGKRSLWSLDMAVIVLPEVKPLLRSKKEVYVKCACDILLLILKSFGPLIKVTVSTPVGAKVDLIREERLEKCQACHSHLWVIRDDVMKLCDEVNLISKIVKNCSLMKEFSVLD